MRVPTMPRVSPLTLLLGALLTACSHDPAGVATTQRPSFSLNGVDGTMPAYFNDQLFTITLKLEPSSDVLLLQNSQVNHIYMCDACSGTLAGGFIAVIDEIQGVGFNPLWQDVEIVFNPGHAPRQLTSAAAILAAQASGELALTFTTEVYRCSVIGVP